MKTVLIVGHCGYDGPRLQNLVQSLDDTQGVLLESKTEVESYLKENKPADLLLINRVFAHVDEGGIDLIASLHQSHPDLKMMLISNFPESQAEAQEKGAVPGFGKAAMEADETKQKLAEALA